MTKGNSITIKITRCHKMNSQRNNKYNKAESKASAEKKEESQINK